MPDDVERPTVGVVPKLLVAALALFGLVMLISWVTSWLFGVVRIVLLLAVVGLAVVWIASRVGGREETAD